jgi:hypothetical protein
LTHAAFRTPVQITHSHQARDDFHVGHKRKPAEHHTFAEIVEDVTTANPTATRLDSCCTPPRGRASFVFVGSDGAIAAAYDTVPTKQQITQSLAALR